MAANLSGGMSEATKQLVQDINKQGTADAQAKAQQNHDATSTQGTKFSLNDFEAGKVSQSAKVDQTSKAATTNTSLKEVFNKAKSQEVAPSQRIGATEKVEESKLQGMIDNLVNGQDKMTKIMQMALSGRQFGPSELLAMQAGVYRYSQELDLTSKVVQQATAGIKQTLNTQV